jgi:PAS domain-containing protein
MVTPSGRSSKGWPAPGSTLGRRPVLRTPLSSAPVPLVITDTSGVVSFANAAFADLAGTSTTDLTGRSLLGLVQADDRRILARRIEAVAADGPIADLLIRMHSGDRVLPCLVGGAAAGSQGPRTRLLWVMVRPSAWWGEPGYAGVTRMAVALSRLSLNRRRHVAPLQRIREAASWCREVTGVGSEVGLVVRGRDGRDLLTGTSESAHSWGQAQLDAGQGPAVLASSENEVVRASDLGLDPRFPSLLETVPPGHSAVSCPVSVDQSVVGVLTVYDGSAALLEVDDLVVPSLAAAAAAIASQLSEDGT